MQSYPGSPEGRYDYFEAEHYTGQAWIDGNPIYRRVIDLIGGDNSTVSAAISEIDNIRRDTILRLDFALRSPLSGALIFQPEGLLVDDATGVITVLHTGANFTGLALHVIVEYTKV